MSRSDDLRERPSPPSTRIAILDLADVPCGTKLVQAVQPCPIVRLAFENEVTAPAALDQRTELVRKSVRLSPGLEMTAPVAQQDRR